MRGRTNYQNNFIIVPRCILSHSISLVIKTAKNMAKLQLHGEWGLRPSTSATHRKTGWGLHQRRWSNEACATPQRRPRPSHELAWIWTDFLSEQRRAKGLVETAGRMARAGGKRQPARCSRKTQDKFAIASMAKKLVHRCTGAHARVYVHFLRRVRMHFDRCCEYHACAGVHVKQVWGWGGSASLWEHLLLGVGCYFWLMER